MELIDNLSDYRIEAFKDLKQKAILNSNINSAEIYFIAEGEKVVSRILNSNYKILSVFALEQYYSKYEALINKHEIPQSMRFYCNKELMNQVIGFKVHTGIMAKVKQPNFVELSDLETPIVILNSIVNSENVGSIVRNAAAFNIKSLIFDNSTSSPYLRRAVRVSMGNVINIKIHKSNDLISTINTLKAMGIEVISAELSDKALNINEHPIYKNSAIILGNEGNGIEQAVLDVSSKIIFIPINPEVPSLNVAATSAILFNSIKN